MIYWFGSHFKSLPIPRTNVVSAIGGAWRRACSVDSKIGYLLGSTRVCQKKLPMELWWPHRSLLPSSLPSSVSSVSPPPSKDAEGTEWDQIQQKLFTMVLISDKAIQLLVHFQFCIPLNCILKDVLFFRIVILIALCATSSKQARDPTKLKRKLEPNFRHYFFAKGEIFDMNHVDGSMHREWRAEEGGYRFVDTLWNLKYFVQHRFTIRWALNFLDLRSCLGMRSRNIGRTRLIMLLCVCYWV